jgi:ABC-type Fe3+ transport system permease subunit
MTLRTNIIGLALSATMFAACCVAMLKFGPQMDKALVYPFMAVWGVSALAWPLFAVRVIRAALSATGASLRRARQSRRGGYY